MEYKKIKRKYYNIHCIKTDRFKAINVDVFFTKETKKEDISYSNLLCKTLVYSTSKYNTKNKFAIELEELYAMKCNSSFAVKGNTEYINVSLEFLNPKYTEKTMYEESLKFLKEVLFNPHVKAEEFDPEFFELNKNNLILQLESLKANPFLKSELKYRSIMYKGTPTEYSTLGTIEEFNKITPKKLYNFYKKLFSDYKIDIIVLGDVDNEAEELMLKKIDDIFASLKPKEIGDLNPFIKYNPSKKVVEVVEKEDFNQSQLYLGYRIADLTEFELRYVLKLYNFILGKMNNSILFDKVRGKNSLCYSIGSRANVYNTSITINSGINKVNFKKAVKLIEESIADMSDPSKIKPLFNHALKSINTMLNNYYDDVYAIIDYYYKLEFETVCNIEEERETLLSLTVEDVVSLGKKLYLSTVYLLEGKSE